MTDIAIRVENISKQYRIGGRQERYRTLRDTIVKNLSAPFRRLWSVIHGQSTGVSNETIWALKKVSFDIKQGEVVGIIGRNGAGKSTLLKILSQITEPTEGHAEIHGRIGSLLEIGTGFHPELTGKENIFLNGAILGMKKTEIKRKFDEIVSFSEIGKFIDTPVKHYSSGMYLRLAFSLAAHLDPEIMLIDEVLAVGDIQFQQKCIHKMSDVAKEGRTVLVVSHNMRVIETLADQCLYLDQGVLEGNGPVLEIVKQYQTNSLSNSAHSALPSHFNMDIIEPKAIIRDITLTCDNGSITNMIDPKSSVRLSFDIEVTDDISDAVVCVYFCKDGLIVSGNNSNHMIGGLSLNKNLRTKFDIQFKSIPFIPGEYTILIFVLPSYFSQPTDSLSKFHTVKMVVLGSRRHGGGYIRLRQNWRITNK